MNPFTDKQIEAMKLLEQAFKACKDENLFLIATNESLSSELGCYRPDNMDEVEEHHMGGTNSLLDELFSYGLPSITQVENDRLYVAVWIDTCERIGVH